MDFSSGPEDILLPKVTHLLGSPVHCLIRAGERRFIFSFSRHLRAAKNGHPSCRTPHGTDNTFVATELLFNFLLSYSFIFVMMIELGPHIHVRQPFCFWVLGLNCNNCWVPNLRNNNIKRKRRHQAQTKTLEIWRPKQYEFCLGLRQRNTVICLLWSLSFSSFDSYLWFPPKGILWWNIYTFFFFF